MSRCQYYVVESCLGWTWNSRESFCRIHVLGVTRRIDNGSHESTQSMASVSHRPAPGNLGNSVRLGISSEISQLEATVGLNS